MNQWIKINKKERREEKKNKQINMQTYKLNQRKLSFAIY